MNGHDHPTLKDLDIQVVPLVHSHWYKLGKVLLDPKHGSTLDVDTLAVDTKNDDTVTCCWRMFSRWLETDHLASWNKLIEALTLTGINDVASDIKQLLLPPATTRAAEGATMIDHIINKDDTPTERDLTRYVGKNYAADWKDIGIELGVSFDMMEIIEKDNSHQIVACLREVLNKWLKTTPNATWKTLEAALSNVRRQQIGSDPLYAATTADSIVVIDKIKNKDDTPTMRDLNRYVVTNYATDWKDIGIELGLGFDMLEFIEKDHPQQTAAFRQSLHKWLKFTPNATWRTLEIAITNVKRQHAGLDPVDDVLTPATAIADGTVVIDQIKNKDDIPTERDLNRYVVENYAADWKDIGIELGLNSDVVACIEKGYPHQTVACFQKTLYRWLKHSLTATWRTLEVALTNVRRRQLGLDPVDDVHGTDLIAAHLKERYCDAVSQSSGGAGSLYMTQPCPIVGSVKITKNISSHSKQNSFSMKFSNIEQFFSEFGDNLIGVTLIEGDPGIGKTTLIKTLSAKWATGKMLTFSRYLFVLLLRDPAVQKITTLQKMSKYLIQEGSKAEQLCSYLESVNGENIVFLLDGLDEINSDLFQSSYFQKLISGQHLPKAAIMITSRPSTAALLNDFVHWKIDILGFDKSSMEQYAVEALKNFPDHLIKLQKHFKEHSHIAALCCTPSIMHIITFLCSHQPDDHLPQTATEMYMRFILLTIKRSLKTEKAIKRVDDLPSPVTKAYQQLGKFAYDHLVEDKIVFSAEELPELCRYDPTCYGLLQTVEHYSSAAPTRSFNFVHFSLQEYLAATHVASFPPGEVDERLLQSFLIRNSNSGILLYNMWVLFCGITGGQCVFLRNYLATHSPDPIKIIYLYHCFFEAQDDKMCDSLSMWFENTINLKDYQLEHQHWITSLGVVLSESSHKWKELNLYNCHIGDYGFHLLYQYICRCDKEHEIATIDLRENDLTELTLPLVCSIINCFCPHTLKLGCNYIASMQGISDAIKMTSTVKVLDLWGIGVTDKGGATLSQMLAVLVELNVSNNYLADQGAILMSEGIGTTKTLQKLYINDNEIGPSGTKAIARGLSVNTSLEVLNMSKNAVGKDGAIAIAEAIATNRTLAKLYFWDDKTLDEELAMIIIRNLHLNDVIIKVGYPKRLASDNRLVSYLDNINGARHNNKIQELVLAFF